MMMMTMSEGVIIMIIMGYDDDDDVRTMMRVWQSRGKRKPALEVGGSSASAMIINMMTVMMTMNFVILVMI